MNLKSDLSKCEVGDWVCIPTDGWAKVEDVFGDSSEGGFISVRTETGKARDYYFDGRRRADDIYPTCFPIDQVPQPYLDIFGPPPCEFRDGEPVWVSGNGTKWYPRIFKKYVPGYCPYKAYDSAAIMEYSGWEHCAPWNNGQPPEEE